MKSGVKRRLFQSLRGHSFFIVLTSEIIAQELRDFFREHFKEAIHRNQPQAIKGIWDKIILGDKLQSEDIHQLRALDISEAKQNQLIEALGRKYAHQFTNSPEFAKQIKDAFCYKTKNDAHILNFGHLISDDLFEDKVSKNTELTTSLHGFFASQPEQEDNREDMECPASLECDNSLMDVDM